MRRLAHHATFVAASILLSLIVFCLEHLGGRSDPHQDIQSAVTVLGLFWVAVLFIRLSHQKGGTNP